MLGPLAGGTVWKILGLSGSGVLHEEVGTGRSGVLLPVHSLLPDCRCNLTRDLKLLFPQFPLPYFLHYKLDWFKEGGRAQDRVVGGMLSQAW